MNLFIFLFVFLLLPRSNTLYECAQYIFSLAPHGANPPCDRFICAFSTFQLTRPDKKIILAHGFQLTRPARGEPIYGRQDQNASAHFNSLAPHGANLTETELTRYLFLFQLTRPARGEPIFKYIYNRAPVISSHSPRTGRTLRSRFFPRHYGEFQLTRPARSEPKEINTL